MIHQSKNSLSVYTCHKPVSIFTMVHVILAVRAPVTFTPWNDDEKHLSHNIAGFITNMTELKSILSNYSYNSGYMEAEELFSLMTC